MSRSFMKWFSQSIGARQCVIAATCFASLVCSSYAEESADTIQTSGSAELGVFSNYLFIISEKKYAVKVPSRISVGDTLQLHYSEGNKAVSRSFTVVSIGTRGDICWLHYKHETQGGSMNDTVYVKPCRKLR
jgi:hypothetical protein